MNAIDKLKNDLARYHTALVDIERGVYATEPSAIAHKALHPVQRILPPVTVEEIIAALEARNKVNGALHSIRFYSDGSGHLYNEMTMFFAGFVSLREALDILENKGV